MSPSYQGCSLQGLVSTIDIEKQQQQLGKGIAAFCQPRGEADTKGLVLWAVVMWHRLDMGGFQEQTPKMEKTTKNPSEEGYRKKQGLPLGKLALAFVVYKACEHLSSAVAHWLTAENALSCNTTCLSSPQHSLTLLCSSAGPPLTHNESSAWFGLSSFSYSSELLLMVATIAFSLCLPEDL